MKGDLRTNLLHLIDHLAHLLPAQGPIGVFIHHNTLHAFESMPFETAVLEGARTFGTEPFMSEAAYRQALDRGRIEIRDIDAVLAAEPNEPVVEGGFDRHQLRRAMLVPGVRDFHSSTVKWRLEEGDLGASLRHASARALFETCRTRATVTPQPPASAAPRFWDNIVHPLLIRLSANYLDQGMAYWPMPNREKGFLAAVRLLLTQPLAVDPPGMTGLAAEFRRLDGADAAAVILTYLDELDIEDPEHFLKAELLALPGWAGLFAETQKQPELLPYIPVPASLVDYLAVRLTLVAVAIRDAQASALAPPPDDGILHLVAVATLFDAAAALNLDATQLNRFTPAQFSRFEQEVLACSSLERRRILHLAYERRHEASILSPLAQHLAGFASPPAIESPTAQVFFCIDDREESFRRHLEEVAPAVTTFGAAGFFGVAMQFTGIDDALGAPLCPIVMKPGHAVDEQPVGDDEHLHGKRQSRRRLWSRIVQAFQVSGRLLVRGWVSTALLGIFSLFPLLTRVLAPRTAGRLRQWLNAAFLPEPRTELAFARQENTAGDPHHELDLGFSVQEKVDRVAGLLRTAGLTDRFARLVVVLGHGSTSLNNPHRSAYDCGACGGRSGGPNARIFAAMANRPAVREGLRAIGIDVPADTWFVGGYHDTCSDAVELSDLDVLPATHQPDLQLLRQQLDQARALNAQERTRRFDDASPADDPAAALRHVEARAEHLAQPRPEYGHSSNAVCLVGRREFTKGLFFDRRAFLVSYDPTIDADNANLCRLLNAIFLVCGGINLEYYFSYVDNEGYGCGTKLPHNVTGLVGVMNGHASDLRTGLTWQMVEIHEPVRILFVIETTPERLNAAIASNPANAQLVNHRWIRLATMDPDTRRIHVRREQGFEPYIPEARPLPVAASSRDWYRGHRDHLPVARIAAGGRS